MERASETLTGEKSPATPAGFELGPGVLQAVYLDDANVPADVPSADVLKAYARAGIRVVAPPMWVLLSVKHGKIVPSQYAKDARAAKLDIITWTPERSGRIVEEVLPTKGTAAPSFY